ncbi:MAG: precorrin-6A/cobalt-precorrin-6A reductase, partial [Christensenellales bacterium]
TEGREQAALALARGEDVRVSVTSEYARQFLPEGAACHIGALDEAAMKAWIAAERPERVIDATHPFAVRATQTIRACADALHIPYVRIERAADRREDRRDAVTWAGNSEEAALAALCAETSC